MKEKLAAMPRQRKQAHAVFNKKSKVYRAFLVKREPLNPKSYKPLRLAWKWVAVLPQPTHALRWKS
jgi:hypothetical protein